MKKIKKQDTCGHSFGFYVERADFQVVKDFDYIAEELKESNRSREIIAFMKRYIAHYSTDEEESTEEEPEELTQDEVQESNSIEEQQPMLQEPTQ